MGFPYQSLCIIYDFMVSKKQKQRVRCPRRFIHNILVLFRNTMSVFHAPRFSTPNQPSPSAHVIETTNDFY